MHSNAFKSNVSNSTFHLNSNVLDRSNFKKIFNNNFQTKALNLLNDDQLIPLTPTNNQQPKLVLINSINMEMSNSISQTTSLDLMYLNIWFAIGYGISLILTSALISRLYLNNKKFKQIIDFRFKFKSNSN